MQTNNLKLGKSVEIHVSRGEYTLKIVSKIEYVNEDRIYVSLITGRGRPFQFVDGDQIEFIYKEDGRLYRWEQVVGSIAKIDGCYVHCFTTSAEGKSYNRRNAFRVYVGYKTDAAIIKKQNDPVLMEQGDTETPEVIKRHVEIMLKDLSEGGAGFYSNQELEFGDMIRFAIQSDSMLIECVGHVVRKEHVMTELYSYFYGIGFTEVSKNISKHIFEMQRIQLANTRG